MRFKVLGAAVLVAIAAGAYAQTYNQTTTTTTSAEDRWIIGEVVRYEPGQTIVIRRAGNEVTYTLAPSITVPSEVAVGRTVRLYVDPAGSTTVTRVTTSTTPEGRTVRTTEQTRTNAAGETTKTRTTTISGDVVRYEPGRTIVIRQPEKGEVTYTLSPRVQVPADIRVGRAVTLYTEPGESGNVIVSRVTTTSLTPEGNVKRTTEETRTHPSGMMTKTTTTTISGKVEAFEPGKTITLINPAGEKTTYVINTSSRIPADLVVGKEITVHVVPGATSEERVVQTVTYTKTKHGRTTTKTKTTTKKY